MQTPKTEVACQPSTSILSEHPAERRRVVVEDGADFSGQGFDLGMGVVGIVDREARALNERSRLAKAAIELEAVTTRVQENNFRIHFVRVEGNSVASLIEMIIAAEESAAAIVADASGDVSTARERIGDGADGRFVIADSLAAAADP